MYLPLLIKRQEKRFKNSPQWRSVHCPCVSGLTTPQGTRGSDLVQLSGHFYTSEALPSVVTTAALGAGQSQKHSHKQLILLPRRSFPLPGSTQSGRGHGLVGAHIISQRNNSKAYNTQVKSTQVVLNNSFKAKHIMDSCPDLRKTRNIRQCPFYQQVFRLPRNHTYCRSRSRSTFRIELRSSYCVVQLHGCFKQVGALGKMLLELQKTASRGTVSELKCCLLRTDQGNTQYRHQLYRHHTTGPYRSAAQQMFSLLARCHST